jgi:cell division protein FtsZ
MQGDLRVTMVATGIGEVTPAVQPYKVVHSVQKAVDYEDYEAPTVIRNRREDRDLPVMPDEKNMDYLDIPAFLRRQAD